MDKLKRALSGDDGDEEAGIMTQLLGEERSRRISDSSTLSYSTRIKGFVICFIVGIVLSVLGSFFLFLNNGLIMFAIFYTLGNLTAIASTCFLMGPLKQLKRMFAETRLIATIVVLICIVMTIVSAILWPPAIALIFVCIQFLAMTWYSISYIPFARDAVKKCFEGCIG